MILDMETTKVFLTVSIFVLMTFSLFVSIRYGSVNKWTYLMIPIVLILSMTVKNNIEDMLGYPTYKVLKHEQLYVSHLTGINKEFIYVWAIDKNVSWVPRAFKIDYTKENEKKLNDAKESQSAGIPIGVTIEPPPIVMGGDEQHQSVRVNVYNKFTGHTKNNGANDNER